MALHVDSYMSIMMILIVISYFQCDLRDRSMQRKMTHGIVFTRHWVIYTNGTSSIIDILVSLKRTKFVDIER